MSIKKLAGQTLWYGVPRIFSRFLYFGISLLGIQLYDPNNSYPYIQIYAVIPFLNTLYTYGLETSYFRFAQLYDKQKVYNTLFTSILCSTILFTLILLMFREPFARLIEMERFPDYVLWMIGILFFDTLYTIPMAKLRQEERPRKYAFINMAAVMLNIALVLFFYYVARPAHEKDPGSFPGSWFDPSIGIGYFILSNMIASGAALLLLYKEFSAFQFKFDYRLWKEVIRYSAPLVIVGFGGMINEMLSRVVYLKVLSDEPSQEVERELGIFGANYKLAVLITIFIQIFRMAAEPFFFNQSKHEGAQKTYARVMKFFVIACCFMFLIISLFLDFWKILITSGFDDYGEGLRIVPILSMAGIFLGIYYNLSIWYKLTGKNMTGAWITLSGAMITIVLNLVLIKEFRYEGASWATFVCYGFMMVISYILGQKYYPVPYPKKKLITYLVIVSLIYILHEAIVRNIPSGSAYYLPVYYGTSVMFFLAFALLIVKVERKEMEKMPVIGKYFKPKNSL